MLSSKLLTVAKTRVFQGALDQWATSLVGVYAMCRLLSGYTGPLARVQRAADNEYLDVGYDSNGLIDVAAIDAFVGGSGNTAYIRPYNQVDGVLAVQATKANQPTLDRANLAMRGNGSSQYLNTGLVPTATYTGVARVSEIVAGADRYAFGAARTGGNQRFGVAPSSVGGSFGRSYIWGSHYRVGSTVDLVQGVMALAGKNCYVDGVSDGQVAATWTNTDLPIYLFALNNNGNPSGYLSGLLHAAVFADTVLDAAMIANITTALLLGSQTYTVTFEPNDLFENGYNDAGSGYYISSPFAYAELSTTATQLVVDINSTITSTFPSFDQVNVILDGGDYAVIDPMANGASRYYLSFPAGNKTIKLVAGLQSKPSSTVVGTFLVGLEANAPVTIVSPSSNNRLLVYGDSISVGGNSSVPSRDGWVPLLRALRGNVMLEGWGYRALHDDASTPELRAAFVARLASYVPSKIWLAIGTNDYGLNKWSAASFGTTYAALLDDLHAALPDVHIYCQSPITRTNESANGNGSTLGDYRTQISNAVSTRSGYCTYVDGAAWSIALADGVHPTTAGHATYANAVKTVLGL